MDQLPWYRRLFAPKSTSNFQATLSKAEGGDAESQFALGLKFSNDVSSLGLTEAARWYARAAEQNHPLAQFNLGVMLAAGQGVPQNAAAALMWTRKAAEGGDAGAQFLLGSRYHRSSINNAQDDSEECRVEAYKWFYLAAEQGYRGSAAARERLTLTMSQAEVDDGNRRASAFVVRTSA